MSDLLRVLAGTRMKPKPAPPTSTQQLFCGEGRRGRITQTRSVVWNVDKQLYDIGPWTYQSDNCVTVPRPADSQTLHDCPAGQSGYRVYTRSVTWNASAENWTTGGWVLAQSYCNTVSVPPSQQTISCPAGYTGSGQVQQRSVTWNAATESYDVGPWNTVQFNCVIAAFRAWGPVVRWRNRDYDQTASANGYSIRIRAVWNDYNITYEVWCPQLAGRQARPAWEKMTYHNGNGDPGFKTLDANGYASYGPVNTRPHNVKSNEDMACLVDIQ